MFHICDPLYDPNQDETYLHDLGLGDERQEIAKKSPKICGLRDESETFDGKRGQGLWFASLRYTIRF